MRFFLPILFTLGLIALNGCGTELDSRGDALRILATSLDPAFIDEAYSADIRVAGGLSPYTLQITGGTLPPGLSLEGSTVRGVPTEIGDYTFTVTVSDGRLSKTFQEYNLNVGDPPPATLTLNVPSTEVQRPITLRAQVREARSLQAFRTQITWNPELFAFAPDSLRAASDSYALFFEEADGELQVDVAVLGGTVTGERNIFEFTLSPIERTTLAIESATEFLSDTNDHAYTTNFEGITSDLERTEEPLPDDTTNPENNPDDETNPEEDNDDGNDDDENGDPGETPSTTNPAGDGQ